MNFNDNYVKIHSDTFIIFFISGSIRKSLTRAREVETIPISIYYYIINYSNFYS